MIKKFCLQLVSYAAVLQRISKYEAFHKPHCIASLLEFFETIHVGITCRGKPEEDLLAAAVLSIVHWLLQCYQHALSIMPQTNPLMPQSSELLDKPANMLKEMLSCDFMCAMMYLAKQDDKELFASVMKKCQEIEMLIKVNNQIKSSSLIEEAMKKLSTLSAENLSTSTKVDMEPITYCLQPLLTVHVLLNPCTETSVFVSQLLVIQRLKNYTNARFYCEIIRAGLTCLRYAVGTLKESQWAAFAFLKMPLIIKELHFQALNDGNQVSTDIYDAFELLLQFNSLLDIMDASCSCNCFEFLLMELQKYNLISEKLTKQLCSKRFIRKQFTFF